MSKNNIAVTVALVVVLGVLLTFAAPAEGPRGKGGSSLFGNLSLPFSKPVPNLAESFNVTSAWSAFQDYLKFAEKRDLEGVKSLSYQLSPTCANPETRMECNVLMDNVYLIGSGFRLEDFTNISYDDKQIIMSTNYMPIFDGSEQAKVVIFFVKSEQGEAKVLGIRFCYRQNGEDNTCVITDPETRDADQDGWWDDVEALFK